MLYFQLLFSTVIFIIEDVICVGFSFNASEVDKNVYVIY